MNPYLAIVLLLICSAFFSSAEIAYASANASRLRKAAESGSKRGKWALKIKETYSDALCSILIGNNLVNIASSSAATTIALALMGEAGIAAATGIMTVLLLIFGEIVPKQLAKRFCDAYVLVISPVLMALMWLTKPLVWLCMKLIHVVSKIWGGKQEVPMTYDDLADVIKTVEEEGVIDEDCGELLQSALDFDETEVREIITHRTDMLALDIDDPAQELIRKAVTSNHSRIPVYQESIDNVIGVLYVGRLLNKLLDTKEPQLRPMLAKPMFVPMTQKISAVLDQMRRKKQHLAIVTDDYGGTLGIVTMEDILEEIVGEIWDETDEIEPNIVKLSDTSFMMDGDTMLHEFLEYIEIEDEELEDDIITVSGWTTDCLGDYPHKGDSFIYQSYQVTVVEVKDFCVSKFMVQAV